MDSGRKTDIKCVKLTQEHVYIPKIVLGIDGDKKTTHIENISGTYATKMVSVAVLY